MKIIFLILAACIAMPFSIMSANVNLQTFLGKALAARLPGLQSKLSQNKARINIAGLASFAALVTGIGLVAGSKKHMRKIRKNLHEQSTLLEVLGPKKVSRLKKALRKYKAMHGVGAAVVSLSTVALIAALILRGVLKLIPKQNALQRAGNAIGRRVEKATSWFHSIFP
jgi:predicted phage tail protein